MRFAVVKFTSDGVNNSSVSTFSLGGTFETARGIAYQADGKRVVVGWSLDSNNNYRGAIFRLTVNDTFDQSFSGDGKYLLVAGDVTLGTLGFDAITFNAVAIQPDGKIVAVGTGEDPSFDGQAMIVARFNTDGTLDPSFNGKGTRVIRINNSTFSDTRGNDVVLQPDGKIVVIGSYTLNGNSDIAVARLLPDGTSDISFAPSIGTGRKSYALDRGATSSLKDDSGVAGAFTPSGQIVIAATTERVNTDSTLLRISGNTAPSLNTSGVPYLIAPAGARFERRSGSGDADLDVLNRGVINAIADTDIGDAKGGRDLCRQPELGELAVHPCRQPDGVRLDTHGCRGVFVDLVDAAPALTARVRHVTTLKPHHSETVAQGFLPTGTSLNEGFSYFAWDGTQGKTAGRGNASSRGDATAYSTNLKHVQTHFEVRIWRSFNTNAALNYYTLQAEFEASPPTRDRRSRDVRIHRVHGHPHADQRSHDGARSTGCITERSSTGTAPKRRWDIAI